MTPNRTSLASLTRDNLGNVYRHVIIIIQLDFELSKKIFINVYCSV